MSVSEWEFILRIAVAALLGATMGYEREHRLIPVGARTFALVAMGSAAFIAASILVSEETAEAGKLSADQVRVAAGLVAGVGT